MIITDGTHLVSTVSADELHIFAQAIGLRREWFQDTHPSGQASRHPHYDMTSPRTLARAKLAGAQTVSGLDLLRMAWWSAYKSRKVAA